MSTYTHESMTNHHVQGSLARILETIHVWRERQRSRGELAKWAERDVRDAGMSPGEVSFEAGKPFWEA